MNACSILEMLANNVHHTEKINYYIVTGQIKNLCIKSLEKKILIKDFDASKKCLHADEVSVAHEIHIVKL